MKRRQNTSAKSSKIDFLLPLCFVLTILGCKNNNITTGQTSEGQQIKHIDKPFEYSDEGKLTWEEIELTAPPKTFGLDINKIPSRSFDIIDFKPLKTPITTTSLDWENIPTHTFDSITSIPFELTISRIPKPEVKKMDMPSTLADLKTGWLNLSQRDGLPDNTVMDIISDGRDGHWISNFSGLSHYDGEKLKIYPYKEIEEMKMDANGLIWTVSNGQGVYILDFAKGEEYHFDTDKNFSDLLIDKEGKIWFSWFHEGGLYKVDMEALTLTDIPLNLEDDNVSMVEDQDQNLWIGGKSDLFVLSPDRKTYKKLDIDNFDINYLTGLFEDSKGNIWTTSWDKGDVVKISIAQNTVSYLHEFIGKNKGMAKINEDAKGQIHFLRDDDLSILSSDHRSIKNIPINANVVANRNIGPIKFDNDGNLWIGTIDRGILLKDLSGFEFEQLDENENLSDGNIWSIEEDDQGSVWLGSTTGIDIISKDRKHIKTINQDQLKTNEERLLVSKILNISPNKMLIDAGRGFSILDLKNNTISQYSKKQGFNGGFSDAFYDKNKVLWLITTVGIIQYLPGNTTMKKSAATFLNGGRGLEFAEDNKGNLWFGSDKGLMQLDPSTNEIKYLTKEDGLCDNDVMQMVIDEHNKLWVVTINGLSIINIDQQTICNLGKKEGLYSTELYDITQKEDKIYVGSVDGLILINKQKKENSKYSLRHYGSHEGFVSNDYHSNTGEVISNGELWTVASPSSRLTILKNDPQLNSNEINVHITSINIMDQNPIFYDKSDEGLAFYKGEIKQDSGYLFSNNIKWDGIEIPDNNPVNLKLPYDQNAISFTYSNASVFHKDKIEYRYKLEGSDVDWIYANSDSETPNYYNLKPNHYTFKVETKRLNESWSKPDELSFTILPPWWQTWWAYLIFAAIFAAALRSYIVYRSRKLVRENKKLEDMVNERTKELGASLESLKNTQSQLIQSEKMASLGELTAGIAHEIQNPLNFVNNFSEVSAEMIDDLNEEVEKGDLEEVKAISQDLKENLSKITHHGQRASNIVKGMLEHSRKSSGEKVATDINALADEYLRLAYHGLRAKDRSFNSDFKTDFDANLPMVNVVSQDIGRVVLNLIHNAFQAVDEKAKSGVEGYKPQVTITTKQTANSQVLIAVKDNGPGIPEEIKDKIFQPFFTTKETGKGTGLGLSLAYDIVKAHGGELSVESKEGEGTKFMILLPTV